MALPHAPVRQVLPAGEPPYAMRDFERSALLEGPPGLDTTSRGAPESGISQDMLTYISQRVNHMLATATRSSELQVHTELRRLESSFAALADKVRRVETLLGKDKARHSEPVLQDNLDRLLANIEQRREQEMLSLKRELHQIIMVHNHNADLMADHKVAIDQISTVIEEPKEGKPTAAQLHNRDVHQHIQQIASTLEENSQQEQDVDALLERGEVILQRVGKTIAAFVAPYYQQAMPAVPGLHGLGHMPYPPESYMGAPMGHLPFNHPGAHPLLGANYPMYPMPPMR
ncbi:unnamed protein product [Effrenium voratum]|uniref:Uncharacterized protein n=1 Tax=Effrenium voratum TaxID=2562239 RepID=A0AA36JH17_9DINO|nr:unnamed protein product [Effrenium voratum]CAJ1440677.1 unnamed protein product [Effrenium voratum]